MKTSEIQKIKSSSKNSAWYYMKKNSTILQPTFYSIIEYEKGVGNNKILLWIITIAGACIAQNHTQDNSYYPWAWYYKALAKDRVLET